MIRLLRCRSAYEGLLSDAKKCIEQDRHKNKIPLTTEAVKSIRNDRAGTAGVPACPCRKEPTPFYRVMQRLLVELDTGRRGRLRSQHDRS